MLILLFGIIFVIVALDQVTKLIFATVNYSVLGDYLWFFSTQNDGAAFSMLEGGRWWFVAIAIPVVALLIYLMISGKMFKSKFFKVTLAIMIGGIIGNLIDRIFLGYVRDFIYLKFINFAVFNIADMALTISCIMLFVFVLFFSDKENSKSGKKDSKLKNKVVKPSNKVVKIDNNVLKPRNEISKPEKKVDKSNKDKSKSGKRTFPKDKALKKNKKTSG